MWLHNTASGQVEAPNIPCHAAGEKLQLSVLVDECFSQESMAHRRKESPKSQQEFLTAVAKM